MATLIAVYTGRICVGRCDAKCYAAKHKNCDCICGGKNHGAGETKALENTRDHCQEWLKQYAKEKGLTDYTAEVSPEAFQARLFALENFSNVLMEKG